MKQNRRNIYETIAIVTPAIAREGITKQVANQIIGLQQSQVNICLIVLSKSNLDIIREYGVDITTVPILQLQGTVPYLSPRAFAGCTLICWPILRFLKEQKVTNVIAHAPYAHFVMRLAKLAAPLVCNNFILIQYFHGLQYSEYPVNTSRRHAINGLNKWLAKRCDGAHISVSKVVQREISQYLVKLPNHIIIYNSLLPCINLDGVVETTWQMIQPVLQQAKAKYKILVPNRIDYNKGQLFLLKVLEEFFRTEGVSKDDVAVFVVGDGPQKQEFTKAVIEKGLEKTIVLLGELPNAVVEQLMQQVQLVIVPSLKEGLPFTVLEALRAKCLILASRTGGIPEIISNRTPGFLFEAGNTHDCLRQLMFIFNHRHKLIAEEKVIEEIIQSKFSLRENTEKLIQFVLTLNDQAAK